jgi:hypothetical protein
VNKEEEFKLNKTWNPRTSLLRYSIPQSHENPKETEKKENKKQSSLTPRI